MREDEEQAAIDEFYWKNGKCCAGCDYWSHWGLTTGECLKSKILPSHERLDILGIKTTLKLEAGHAITRRDYVCGNFKDDFDWSSLPIFYLKRIGAKL